LRERLEKGGFEESIADAVLYQPDLDRSLEWYEKRLLRDHDDEELQVGCFEQLGRFLSDDEIATLKQYMQKQDVEGEHVLAEQGDLSDQLFFLETCAASAYIASDKGDRHRVRRTLRGTVFGELGFYLQVPRTASVVTDGPGIVYVLDRESLLRMEDIDPEVAAGLNRYMAILLSERLMFTTRTLRAFLM
jgi:SulP family sulfate permease